MLTTLRNARSASASVDGSGTCEALPIPMELPAARTARSVLSVVAVLKFAKLVSAALNGPLGVSDSAKASPLD